MKSLAKKDGTWSLTELHLQGYLVDPSVGNTDPPVLDEVYTNTGTFHFDDYDGDTDGTGNFTPAGTSVLSFTFKVPDFEESEKTEPEMSYYFQGIPALITEANHYEEADTYTFTGFSSGSSTSFPLVTGIPEQQYKGFQFTFTIQRID